MRELRERAEPLLKTICVILAAVVLWQFIGVVRHWNPFRGITVPELPTLTTSTNTPGGPATNLLASAGKGTNSSRNATGTNAAGTNTAIAGKSSKTNFFSTNGLAVATNVLSTTNVIATTGTNANTNFIAKADSEAPETNSVISTNTVAGGTNSLIAATETTNLPTLDSQDSNSIARADLDNAHTNSATNLVSVAKKVGGTNSVASTNAMKGTNALASAATDTNTAPGSKKGKRTAGLMPPEMAGMNFGPSGPPSRSTVELPAAVKARISKITDSEILGPVMRPLPQALLGIAGNVAFLRSANGQTGLVKEGDSLDDIKLLRIGMNRVLIEQGGEKKELMIFEGYGGESLLQNNSTNENKTPK